MKFGLSDKEWIVVCNLVIEPLKNQGCKVYVFGSRARGDQKKFSDLDILYESADPLPMSEISTIKSNLEDSNLPIKVDLVDLRDLADSFKTSVLTDRYPVVD